jgi:branched-chain amino acid transport system permease protein
VDLGLFVQTCANSAVTAGIYGLVAVGLAMVFGVMQMANLAHGEFYMVAAYAVWVLYAKHNWPFFAAVAAGMGIVGAMGLAVERGLFRPMRGQVVSGFIATAGLMYMLQVGVGRIWGVGLDKPVPPAFTGTVSILGANIGWQRVIVIIAAVVMLVILWLFLHRFKLGQALRATAQDPEAAALQGISVNKMTALAMFIGSVFAGAAGALMAPVYPVNPYMGHVVILIAFIVIIVGGLGSIEGTILASIIFGFLYTFVTTVADGVIASIVGVLTMLTVLALRPQGLRGRVKA